MEREVLYVGEDFKNINFKSITNEELRSNGFIQSVGCWYYDKSKYSLENIIEKNLGICTCDKTKLAVIYKENQDDRIFVYNFSKK